MPTDNQPQPQTPDPSALGASAETLLERGGYIPSGNKHFPLLGMMEIAPSLPYDGDREAARWYCGLISEDKIAQHGFLRLDQPATEKHPARCIFIQPAHVRRIEFIAEQHLDEALRIWGY
jgi:hypothetical protein